MAMRLHIRTALPADVETVGDMFADPEYVHTKVRASGALNHTVDVATNPAGAFTVTTRRSMPTDQIPANFRTFIGAGLDVRQVEAWEAPADDGRSGTVVVEIAGAPVRLTGTTSLRPGEGGSVLTYEGEVKATIPLFAGAVEKAAVDAIRSILAAEEAVARAWLAGNRTASTP
jgi:hypothetical protein